MMEKDYDVIRAHGDYAVGDVRRGLPVDLKHLIGTCLVQRNDDVGDDMGGAVGAQGAGDGEGGAQGGDGAGGAVGAQGGEGAGGAAGAEAGDGAKAGKKAAPVVKNKAAPDDTQNKGA